MSYPIEIKQTSKNNATDIKTVASIISKINLVFSNLFGKNQLNKIASINKNPISIFILKYSLASTISKTIPPANTKRNKAFSKFNNTFNVIKECFINIINTYYKKEIQNAR